MVDDLAQENASDVHLSSLKLRSGTWLHLHNLAAGSDKRGVEFISAIHNKCIFVTLPTVGKAADLRVGGRCLVRGFNGTNDFTFTSEILQIQYTPFAHAHLSYPESVKAKVVRQAPRTRVFIPGALVYRDENISIPGTIKDLSITGAMIESSIPFLGERDDKVSLVFSVTFEGNEVNLNIPAVVRHVGKPDAGLGLRVGLEFEEVGRDEKLVLYYLVFTHAENEGHAARLHNAIG